MTDALIEKREVPEWVEKHITMKGGLNEFGEPNFRVIWGGNRTYRVGGMFTQPVTITDEHGVEKTIVTRVADMRTLLRYHPCRWHLERWRGPEFYGDRDSWYRDTWDEESKLHTMGDYPERGDYEHVFYLAMCPHMKPEDKDWCMPCQVGMGEYIDLEPNVEVLDMQIYALQQSAKVSKSDQVLALHFREHVKRALRNKEVSERVRSALRPKFAFNPTEGLGGPKSLPEPKFHSSVPVRSKQDLGLIQMNDKPKTIEEN